MDLWGRSKNQNPLENGNLLVDQLSATCMPPPWAKSENGRTALLRIGIRKGRYKKMRVVVSGIDIDCTKNDGYSFPALVVNIIQYIKSFTTVTQ